MSIITSMLFLQGFLADVHVHELDDDGRAFAQGYGNRVASEQAFATLGRVPAAGRPDAFAQELCTAGACG